MFEQRLTLAGLKWASAKFWDELMQVVELKMWKCFRSQAAKSWGLQILLLNLLTGVLTFWLTDRGC